MKRKWFEEKVKGRADLQKSPQEIMEDLRNTSFDDPNDEWEAYYSAGFEIGFYFARNHAAYHELKALE